MKDIDPINYIAELEKQIRIKYGDIATLPPQHFWNNNKEEEYKKQENNLFDKQQDCIAKTKCVENMLFIDNNNSKRTCKKCNQYSFLLEDDIYFIKFKCCKKCYGA